MNVQATEDGRMVMYGEGSVEMQVIACSCGGVYAIPRKYYVCKQNKGDDWTCPFCLCRWGFNGSESEADKLKRELAYERKRAASANALARSYRDERDTAERQRRGQKAAKTRAQNKIKRGECPCCGKKFADLAVHMQKRHPKWPEERVAS